MLLITLRLSLMYGTFSSHLSQDICTFSLFPPWWLHFLLHSFCHCACSHLVHVEIIYRSIMFHSSVVLLEGWRMHQCREVKTTSFHVMLQSKMKINQWGEKIYVSPVTEKNIEYQGRDKRSTGNHHSLPEVSQPSLHSPFLPSIILLIQFTPPPCLLLQEL